RTRRSWPRRRTRCSRTSRRDPRRSSLAPETETGFGGRPSGGPAAGAPSSPPIDGTPGRVRGMSYVVASIRENPELAIFLTLAIGFVSGRIRVGTFSLGNVVGTLLAGVLVGQLGVEVHPLVKVVFFDLFLFATGYKVGPQFFRGLGRNAVSQALLTVVLCVTSLATTLVAAKVMGYDSGTAAGVMAGAFTESTVIGTASNTIARLDLTESEKAHLVNNIPVAYAVSYLVGTGFVVWFLSSLAPRLLRVDLRAESRKLEE